MAQLFDNEIKRTAEISDCGRYRYELTRTWDSDLPVCTFIMLNPSTADAEADDPTIRRCIGFAKREGCGGLRVLNLFAFRATSPDDMKAADDPIGIGNHGFLGTLSSVSPPPLVIAAWGTHGHFKSRDCVVLGQLASLPIYCLGKTKAGHPRHPLYVRANHPLLPFNLTAHSEESRP